MRRHTASLCLAVALALSACGPDAGDLIVGAPDEGPVVADASPPQFDDVCALVASDGPLDPTEVLLTSFGGRWGDEQHGVDTGRVETGFETPAAQRPICRVDDVVSDCVSLVAFIGEIGAAARVTTRDWEHEHDLQASAASVGPDADVYAGAINGLASSCPEVRLGPDVFDFAPLRSVTANGLEARVDGEVAWIAALARENILVVVTVAETGEGPLREVDLADFERIVERSRQTLDAAPIG